MVFYALCVRNAEDLKFICSSTTFNLPCRLREHLPLFTTLPTNLFPHNSSEPEFSFNFFIYVPSPIPTSNTARFLKLLPWPYYSIDSYNATSLTFIIHYKISIISLPTDLTVSGSLIGLFSGMCAFITIYFHYLLSIVRVQGYGKTRAYVLFLVKFFFTYVSAG